jgi:hypothetical protein
MNSKNPEKPNIGRRDFLQMTGAGLVAASAGGTAAQASASTQPADSEAQWAIPGREHHPRGCPSSTSLRRISFAPPPTC